MRTLLIGLLSFVVAGAVAAVPASGETKKKGVSIGEAAPDFSLQDQDGNTVTLSELRGKVVVLEWFNEKCPFVVKHYKEGHMNRLADQYKEQGVVWLAINSTAGTDNASNKSIAGKWSINRPILNDAETQSTARAYGATNTPHMYVIDKEGKVVYKGAIDDNSDARTESIEGSKNYVAAALDALLAGSTIEQPETKAYGCTVKYSKKN